MDISNPRSGISVPSTPRKPVRDVSKASWTPAQRVEQTIKPLENYAFGDCIGRGASALVYRALNLSTGSTVAIKQFELGNLSPGEGDAIMLEIDLLKNLNHRNIVKYHGFVRTNNTLNIILEYCENGSLSNICRNFGNFPENLVAIYIEQVLEGLVYLHSQGTIHRDIKGANILTTKDGNAKLADFGVASRIKKIVTLQNTVVGTPYWMAPEVIELNGATTSSDIWSLGCTIIELLTGNPPFYNYEPVPALYAIVNCDQPPLPTSISSQLQDFLMQCFKKDPVFRPSADKLLSHPWITQNKSDAGPVASIIQPPRYDEAVKTVQDWNNKKTLVGIKPTNKNTLKQKDSKSHLRQRKQLKPKDLAQFKEDSDYSRAFNGRRVSSEQKKSSPPLQIKRNKLPPALWIEPSEDDFSDVNGELDLSKFKSIVEKENVSSKLPERTPAVLQTTRRSHPPLDRKTLSSKSVLLDFAENNYSEDYTAELLYESAATGSGNNHQVSENLRITCRTVYSQDDPFVDMDKEATTSTHRRDDSYNQRMLAVNQMEDLIGILTKMGNSMPMSKLEPLIDKILELLLEHEQTRKQVISLHGLLPMLEILDSQSKSNDQHEGAVEKLLHCISEVIVDSFHVIDNFCSVGGIPIVCQFSGRKFNSKIRYQSVMIIDSLCQLSDPSLQSFISCSGLHTLATLLEDDYAERSEFNLIAVEAIWKIFDFKGSAGRNDICRVLARHDVLDHLSYILVKLILEREHKSNGRKTRSAKMDGDEDYHQLIQHIIEIFVNFSQTGSEVKSMVASRQVFKRLLKSYSRLDKPQKILVLKFIKNLSSAEANFRLLQSSNSVESLVRILNKSRKKRNDPKYYDVATFIFPTMFNFCRLSRARQEEAAVAGLVPHLLIIAKQGTSPLKQFSLPILCDLAHNGRTSRIILWKYNALSAYLDLTSDPNWQSNAYEAIAAWLQDDTSRLEQRLVEPEAMQKLLIGLTKAPNDDFNGVLESFLQILLQSSRVCKALPMSDLCYTMKRLLKNSKPVVRLGLLKIVKTAFGMNPERSYLIEESGMSDVLHSLATTGDSVLVKQLATELLEKRSVKSRAG